MLFTQNFNVKTMTQSIQEIIEQRYSCRSYTDEPIQETHRQALYNFIMAHRTGPLGTQARFELVSATQDDRQSLKGLGTYGYIKNPTCFIIGAIRQSPKYLEEYGYLLEHIILYATDMGLGTCWLGGTFSKSNFAKKISLRDEEAIPAVVSTGCSVKKNGSGEWTRSYLKANRRFPTDQLFFADEFGNPLVMDAAGEYSQPLEMVRRAPSASNKQPWRIVRVGDAWHFYLQRTKGYGKGTLIFRMLRLADLQRVDIGIAMCHFELSARSLGLRGRWIVEDPKLNKTENIEYTITWINE